MTGRIKYSLLMIGLMMSLLVQPFWAQSKPQTATFTSQEDIKLSIISKQQEMDNLKFKKRDREAEEKLNEFIAILEKGIQGGRIKDANGQINNLIKNIKSSQSQFGEHYNKIYSDTKKIIDLL